jgi:hypothetical protein
VKRREVRSRRGLAMVEFAALVGLAEVDVDWRWLLCRSISSGKGRMILNTIGSCFFNMRPPILI